MKTPSHFRMFIVVATMTATACSDPEIVPGPTTHATSGNNISNREFRTTVTTWSRPDGSNYVGLVSSIPEFDLSKATITVVGNGKTIRVDTFLDVSRLTMVHGFNENYFWATTQNNIMILNFVGQTPTSLPPFPLDVIIVY